MICKAGDAGTTKRKNWEMLIERLKYKLKNKAIIYSTYFFIDLSVTSIPPGQIYLQNILRNYSGHCNLSKLFSSYPLLLEKVSSL